ncbi:probable E3 ubiquitin-protein ligase HERC4 isoform X2 [Protopterus annectens]|uniref:probable E3 ubiquitin-protein ligase HERC4 isoform X2 n=1 Tax=Protopterus annectens TaxID=7888 RepID=UPI001CFBFCA2|nr:probable E3 ubiquitin-protein ligase HERC4 isoform X2 [Protopterus annectens]
MYCCCWGETDCADFGLTAKDQCFPLLYGKEIIYEISFQNGNLVIVLRNGKTILFEEQESLAQQRHKAKVVAVKGESIHTAVSGESHVLFLTRAGEVYELMCFAKKSETVCPRLIPNLQGIPIIQIACGRHHSLALSQDGKLFSWGLNTFGQLGITKKKVVLSSPRHLVNLEGVPLAQISAGGAHSIAVSLSGTVFTWGRNNAGQLGLGSTEDKYSPNIVRSLEQKKTIFVSCGEEHTAILTKDGMVFTFGAGGYGQLGHNSSRNELKPRLVAELLGVQVSQIACGWYHTLAYVCTTGKLYTFGCGLQGQLGNRKRCNQLVPLSAELPLTTKNGESLYKIPNLIKRIHAGGNQSMIIYSEVENCSISEDQFANSMNKRIAILNDGTVQKWINNTDNKKRMKIKREIGIIFSSASCVNGSFLETSNDQHFKTSPVELGVDMSAVYLFFEKVKQRPYIFEEVKTSVKKMLASLTDSPICAEALRVYLIVPELIRLLDEEYDISLLTDLLSNAILNLKKDKRKMFASLLTAFPTSFFKMFVNLYQRVSKQCFQKTMEKYSEKNIKQLKMILHILQSFYQVNLDAGLKIQEQNFYVPEVTRAFKDLRDRCLQLRNWEEFKNPMLLLLSLKDFPCIFDMEGKLEMFELGNAIALQKMIPGMDNSLPVRRENILQDAFHFLRRRSPNNFQAPLQVYFSREQGVDQGGLSQEFFTLVTKELCTPEANIFKHYEDSRLIWFPEDGSRTGDEYHLAGEICGLALYNRCVADFHFPLALYKKLLNIRPTLEDMHELSPTEGRCLQGLLDEDYDDVIDRLMLDFTKLSTNDGSVAELIPDGEATPVTRHNRKQYVDAYVDYVFNTSVKKNFEDFAYGFKKGCSNVMWAMFVPVELMAIIHGNTVYDWEQLEKNAKYIGYDVSSEVIKNFWTVFHDLSEEMKKRFLAFLTGTDRIPVGGMEKFTFTICNQGFLYSDLFYPSANTCARILYLPCYSSIEALRIRLQHALQFFEEFGLA